MPDDRFTLRDAFLRVMARRDQSPRVQKILAQMRHERERETMNELTAADQRFLKSLRIAADAAE